MILGNGDSMGHGIPRFVFLKRLGLAAAVLAAYWAICLPARAQEAPAGTVMTSLRLIDTDDQEWLKRMAERGYPIAQLSLGRSYRLGKGVERNPEQQLAWTKKAADQGFVWAQYEMGRIFETGDGRPADSVEALKWYRLAGAKDHLPALRRLADLKDGADGGEAWQKRFLLIEDQERRFRAALKDIKAEKLSPDELFARLDALGQQGVAKAEAELGGRQIDGRGVPKNMEDGLRRLRKSSELGWPGAMNGLGLVYFFGRGVERDLTKAVSYLKKAAHGNFIPAYTWLAKMTESGEGAPQDIVEAIGLYRMAAEQGDAQAQRRLGELAEQGHGMKKNLDLAAQWYGKAAQAGDKTAKDALARLGVAEPAAKPPTSSTPVKLSLLGIQAMSLSADERCHHLSQDERRFLDVVFKEEAAKQSKDIQAEMEQANRNTAKWACDGKAKTAIQGGLRASALSRLAPLQAKDAEVKFWLVLFPAKLINRRCGFYGEEKAAQLDRLSGQLTQRLQTRLKSDQTLAVVVPLAEEEFANQANKSACDAAARQKVDNALKLANNAAKKGGREF
ncbi:MAG: SEL1-like repeat protein [Rhodospirillales bacterium]|nr:SEL1-like repeat protein [Rhodospirillales bacterium]